MIYTCFIQTVPWAGIQWLDTSILIILIGLSVAIAVISIQKFVKHNKAIYSARQYAPEVAKAFQAGRWNDAFNISQEYEHKTHIALVVLAGLKEWQERKNQLPQSLVNEHMDRAMEFASVMFHYDYKKNLGILDAVGATAPFIGALGGSALTFAFGILLAIPTIWFATHFRNMAQRFEVEMKNTAKEVILYIQTHAS